jgi:hypothetical protein
MEVIPTMVFMTHSLATGGQYKDASRVASIQSKRPLPGFAYLLTVDCGRKRMAALYAK